MTCPSTIDLPATRTEAVEIFAEMFSLIEDYAPAWYSEELHDRAEAALRVLRDMNPRL